MEDDAILFGLSFFEIALLFLLGGVAHYIDKAEQHLKVIRSDLRILCKEKISGGYDMFD